MCVKRWFLVFGLVGVVLFSHGAETASLPGYEEFRRMDRARRLTGQLHSADLLELTRVAPDLIARTAQAHGTDAVMIWGAAELTAEWSAKQALFESAIRLSGTNQAVAFRFAVAAARQKDWPMAKAWLAWVAERDKDNLAPWLVELWVWKQTGGDQPVRGPASWADGFEDYGSDAARARIALLEAGGYSRYAARRLGFMPETTVLQMARDLAMPPMETTQADRLLAVARAMQRRARYLLHELVGQSLENAVLQAARPEDVTVTEANLRQVELERRREQLKTLLATVEREIVDLATELEMIQYFDDVLTVGEETAMKRLAATVRGTGHP